MNKSRLAIVVLILTFVSSWVSASPRHHHNNDGYFNKHERHKKFGRVLSVRPIYETVKIRKRHTHCDNHVSGYGGVTVIHQHAPEQILMGGIIGGIVGHELGRDGNRGIATATGVVIGSMLAHNNSSISYGAGYQQPHKTRVCEKHVRVIERPALVGYRVKYRYRGHVYITRTAEHPGKKIRIGHPHSHRKSYVY